ncbi:MAG: cadherin domain-containing protein [Flavobacterium sp.]|uniref:putative Ig domain-containing protein n=1 Tax=Flavobacterium sp. TaxID=239 RepID=UPI002B499BC3|nr:putative Ig domain-containing protein [Flavobacterium sp.]WRH72861.1 MAG: cadherin domain-containing protein [Flavobacterium sp.]
MEAYYIGDGRSVGYIFTTGTNINGVKLNQVRFSLWNSSTVSLLDFQLEISEAYYEAQAHPEDPVLLHSNLLYQQTFSKFVDTNYGQLNTGVTLNTPFTLIANRRYIVSIRQTTNIGSAGIYLRTHNLNSSGSVTLYPNLNSSSPYFKYVNGSNWESASLESQYITFELIGSLPNASVTSASISNIQYTSTISATSGGHNVSQADSEITAKGICWATSQNPTISNDFTNEGAGTADFTSTLTNLLPNTTYYVRAYVTDATGTYYGSETSFSTNRTPVIASGSGLSSISVAISENTTAVTTIQATDADVPAQNLTYGILGGADASKFTINSASGVVTFVTAPDYESPTDLDTNNTYIVEVKVTDNGSIAKSATQTITVTVSNVAEIPTIMDANSLTVGITGGTLTGTVVTNGGGGAISERGFIYAPTSVNANPIIGGTGTTKIVVSGTVGNFTKAITGLSGNTSYTFKAFATNTTGSGYSEAVTFTTNGLTAGPSISYEDQTLQQNIAITSITPTNVGTAIPAGNYSKVITFAGSSEGNTNNTNPLAAKFNAPMGMVMDISGNIYFADSYNHRIKKIDGVTGAVTQIAGQTTPTPFLTNDNGSNDGVGVGNARFEYPSGMTYDGQDVLYIADRGNHKIRKLVISTGAVTTIAGGGSGSQSGYANAIGTAARFLRPTDVTFRTENGTAFLYVADAGNHCIRKINLTTNEVSLYAGSNTSGTTDGALTTARFNNPTGVAFSSTGILYIVDRANQKIRKIEAGNVTTFAGSGSNATTNGTGVLAAFADPYGIVIDGGDNLYITQAKDGNYPSVNPGFDLSSSTNNFIRKITPSGVVTNFIGSGTRGTADNNNGLSATLSYPTHMLFDINQKYMYVSEWYGDDIRKVEITGYTISSSLPTGLSFDKTTGIISGTPTIVTNTSAYSVTGYNYYGTSTANFNITVANLPTISTTAITSIASSTAVGGGNATNNGGISLTEKGICWSTTANPTINDSKLVDETTATGAFASNLTGLNALTTYYVRAYATNTLGTSYGAQVVFTTPMQVPNISYNANNSFTLNNQITPLQVTNTGGAVSGLKNYVSSLNEISAAGFADGTASQAQFNLPKGVVVDSHGNIFVADRANHKIRKITPAGMVSTFAGSGTQGRLDGTGTNASFYFPFSITIDKTDNLYVTDSGNHLIRKIDPSANVTTIAGGNNTILYGPRGITIDPDGNLYVCDSYNYRIRKVTPSGVISTFAGSGIQNYTDGTGINATFWRPTAITIDASGNLYVSETGSPNLIRKITPAGVVTTVAGRLGFAVDGTGTSAGFSDPQGMCFDLEGNLIIADYTKFRKMTPEGVVTTISNGYGFGLLNGPLNTAKFDNPAGITADAAGNVYIADERNNTIRKISGTGFAVSPVLPAGLVLNEDGSISGIPTTVSLATDYTITATNAGGSSSYTISIAVENGITTVDAPTASAQTFCPGATVSDLVATGTGLKWYSVAEGGVALNAATVLTGTTYYVSQTVSGTESTRTAVVVTITPTVGSIGSISGPVNLASDATTAAYWVVPVSGATNYIWNLPPGMTITSSSGDVIQVNVSATFSGGSITVKAVNNCSETTLKTLNVFKQSAPSTSIIGTTTICISAGNVTESYSISPVEGAISYQWLVPSGASIVSGANSNEILVLFTSRFNRGSVKVFVLGAQGVISSGTLTVSGIAMPVAIVGATQICTAGTYEYSITAVDGATSYEWILPLGMTLQGAATGTSIVVSTSSSVSGTISVRAISSCGSSQPRTLSISGVATPGYIYGERIICGATSNEVDINGNVNTINQSIFTYSIATMSAVDSYTWTMPQGANVIAGQGTTTISVSFDSSFESGSIRVVANSSSCGTSPSRSVLVSSASTILSGPTNVCGSTTATYSVATGSGSDFVWTVPQGMIIENGEGTNSITVSIQNPINFTNNNQVSLSFTTPCGVLRSLILKVDCPDYSNLTNCGGIVAFNERVYTRSVSGASMYAFDIYDSTTNVLLNTYETRGNFFQFVYALPSFEFGTTYNVKVRVKKNGVYGIAGSSCAVTLTKPVTAIQASQCGQTVTNEDRIYATSVWSGVMYAFDIYDNEGNFITTIEKTSNFFRMREFASVYGMSYQIGVRVKRGNGSYGAQGSRCNITIAIPTTSLVANQCGASINVTDRIYARSVANVTMYAFRIYASNGTFIAELERPYSFFRITDISYTSGATYQVGVKVKQGEGNYGLEGTLCSITIPNDEIKREVTPKDKEEESEALASMFIGAYPNPFTTAFTITPLEGETATLFYQVYDITGKMLESKSVEVSEVHNHTIGADYPVGMYLVIARQGATTQTFKMIKQ